jgi:hypothetical protein
VSRRAVAGHVDPVRGHRDLAEAQRPGAAGVGSVAPHAGGGVRAGVALLERFGAIIEQHADLLLLARLRPLGRRARRRRGPRGGVAAAAGQERERG